MPDKEEQERVLASAASFEASKEQRQIRPKAGAAPVDSEESSGEEKDEAFEKFSSGVGVAENIHKTADLLKNGSAVRGPGFGGLMKAMRKDSLELFEGEAGAMSTVLSTSGAMLGAASIVDGVVEIKDAFNEKDAGDMSVGLMSGGSSVVGGGASILSLAGVASPVAPIAAGFGTGVKIGNYGNHAVQEYGWFKNDDGEAEKASSWAADQAGKADDYVTEHVGHGLLGKAAGKVAAANTLVGASIVGAGASTVAAVDKAVVSPLVDRGRKFGKEAANNKRANLYAGTTTGGDFDVDGIGYHNPETEKVEIVQRGSVEGRAAGIQMANYDDDRDSAIDESKLIHPERWGLPANPYSMMNDIVEKANERTK